MIAALPQRPLALAEYHRLVDLGFYDEDERLEFLEGFVVTMSPQSPEHYHAVNALLRAWRQRLGKSQDVRIQAPLTLARSEPEPDVAIVDAEAADAATRHPTSAHLVVEVALGSLERDLHLKARLYAEAGIAEYWVVDTEARSVIVLREPDLAARRYRSRRTVRAGTLAPAAFPALGVEVASLFARSARRPARRP